MNRLEKLESKSIYVLREVKSSFKKPAVMWSTGKDSTAMLQLIKNAFYGEVPFPVIHLDTGKKFKEIYEFRDRIAKEWGLDLIVAKNEEAIKRGMSPSTCSELECCTSLKTETLKQVLKEHGFDALIMSIRRDEHYMRNLERYFSPRDDEFKWNIVRPKTVEELKKGDAPFVSQQQVEFSGWDLYQTEFENSNHVRVHPILHWNEIDVWNFIKRDNIPFNNLYFSKDNKRYRSLGCECCTNPIKSNAKTIDEIIEELKTTNTAERAGRVQEKEFLMRKLRTMGYM